MDDRLTKGPNHDGCETVPMKEGIFCCLLLTAPSPSLNRVSRRTHDSLSVAAAFDSTEPLSTEMNSNRIDSLVGVWFVDGLQFGEEGILVVTQEGRVVQFPTSVTPPEEYPIHRLWMVPEGDHQVRFCASPRGGSWTRGIEWGESSWTMIAFHDQREIRFRCRRASEDRLPDWFSEMLEESLAWMVEREEREDPV